MVYDPSIIECPVFLMFVNSVELVELTRQNFIISLGWLDVNVIRSRRSYSSYNERVVT
jgi:hypothetical protein